MKKSSLLFFFFFFASIVFAQQRPSSRPLQVTKPAEQSALPAGKVIGSVFSDFFYIVNEPQSANPTKGTNGRNEFDIRRAQFGYEHHFNRNFSGKVLYDASLAILQEANLEWRNIFPLHALTIGMMGTQAEHTAEHLWGYRSLGSLVLNKNGFTQEYDMGISLLGKFNPQGSGYYTVGAFNGAGASGGTENKIKKYALTVGFLPDRMNTIEVYADYENYSLGRSAITGKILYGITGQNFAFGFEGFYRMNRKFDLLTGNDITPAGASLFTWFEMDKGIRGVLRVDGVEDNLKVTNAGYREIYVNAGIDYTPIPEVHIIPNAVYVKYLKKGSSPEIVDGIVARLTAAVYFPTFK